MEILVKLYYDKKDWSSLAYTYHLLFKIFLENPYLCDTRTLISWLAAFSFRLARCGWLTQSQLHLTLAEFLIKKSYEKGELIPSKGMRKPKNTIIIHL